MKRIDDKGITLISLVTTIVILLILTSIATYSGVNIVKQSKFTKFTTQLKMMQTQVNELYEKYSENQSIEVNGIDKTSFVQDKELTIHSEDYNWWSGKILYAKAGVVSQ